MQCTRCNAELSLRRTMHGCFLIQVVCVLLYGTGGSQEQQRGKCGIDKIEGATMLSIIRPSIT